MSEKGPPRDDEKAIGVALFRFSVIASLLEPSDEDASLRERVRALAERLHLDPQHGDRKMGGRTIWTWLALYRDGGTQALRPCFRKDVGKLRALSAAAVERAVELRADVAARDGKTLLDILEHEKLINIGAVHRSTLDRHLVRANASRRQLKILGAPPTKKMRFADFGALWVGDYHHGPRVRAPDGRLVVAKLGAFIDHATRYPVCSRFYLNEQLPTLRDTMLRALLTFGPPKVAYCDRGSVYRAEQFAYSLACIGGRLVHSRAYYSQGRGVIERWWQNADGFEAEIDAREEAPTIHELNRLWEAWVTTRYIEVRHSEIEKTPKEAIADVERKPVDPELLRELFLVRAGRKVHKKDATVSVEAHRFVVDGSLRGRKVELRYDPGDLSSVLVYVEGKRVGRALPQEATDGSERKDEQPKTTKAKPAHTDYLAMLRADYDERLLKNVKPVAYREIEVDPHFDQARFFTLLSDLADVVLRGAAADEATRFFTTFGPLPERIVRVAVEHAVRMHGRSRHVRVYLAAIRTLLIAEMKSPPKKGTEP